MPSMPHDKVETNQLAPDAYTFNFAYIGSRATGNDGGSFLVAGPNWKGEKPDGVREIMRSETDFIWAAYRTNSTTSIAFLRLYWPKEAALDGSWKAPPMTKAP